MAKKPDTRYGGEPAFKGLCGFSLMGEPCANGTIFFTENNREIVEADMLTVNSILLSTFDGLVKFPENPMIFVASNAIISADIDPNAKTLNNLPRYPLAVVFGNRGPNSVTDPDAWEWEYAQRGETWRGNMACNLYESDDPIGFTSHAKIKYLETGDPGWVDYTTWRIPDLGYERFDFAFRIKKKALVLTKIEYRSDPRVNPEIIYKLGSDGPVVNTVADHTWVKRIAVPESQPFIQQPRAQKHGFFSRLLEAFRS